MDWFGSFWRPLKVDEFEAITGQMPLESWKRRRQWRSFTSQVVSSGTKLWFDPALWTWIRCERKLYTLYTPTLPRLTTFGDELFRWNANPGAGSDLNARVETAPGAELQEKNAPSRGARFDYDAYCKLRSTLSETGWMSLRRVTPAAFDKCNLAYVEAGAAISECLEEPYGTVDPQVRSSVAQKLGCGLKSVRLRNWLTGCLLQHAEGSLTDLAVFCAHVLKFAPRTTRGTMPSKGHDPVAVANAHLEAGLRCKKLDCLRHGYLKFGEYARRFDSGDETRLELWKRRLANQPTVSVSSFGEMQQPNNDKCLKDLMDPGEHADPPATDGCEGGTDRVAVDSPDAVRESRTRDSISGSVPPQPKATTEAFSRLPIRDPHTFSEHRGPPEFDIVTSRYKETSDLGSELRTESMSGDEESAAKRRRTDDRADGGSNLGAGPESQHGNASEVHYEDAEKQGPTRWREWLNTPEVQALAESPALNYIAINYWSQLSRCLEELGGEESLLGRN
ncbi:hypothetical protein GNI_046280 [Gregarina niphandrodes]|uniref:Uncharacterized protein n=1 Tax=Gregarina niphandrodes TaxID=110365 RepID=A0A023B9X4_GRENI|nr:hypothetical protein GNI_046280 [Gregarina niphandrodes]EZG75548.1 hypothetical protein GNI_046280 [Gregarina niphandrodes]|eukprot:XP_011129607.1 hypothetical protein GNI_046280 [Gregarina niphandrodes]